jgi:hypothetical protein
MQVIDHFMSRRDTVGEPGHAGISGVLRDLQGSKRGRRNAAKRHVKLKHYGGSMKKYG